MYGSPASAKRCLFSGPRAPAEFGDVPGDANRIGDRHAEDSSEQITEKSRYGYGRSSPPCFTAERDGETLGSDRRGGGRLLLAPQHIAAEEVHI